MALTGSFTTETQQALLNVAFSRGLYESHFQGLHLALFSSDPGETGNLRVSGATHGTQSVADEINVDYEKQSNEIAGKPWWRNSTTGAYVQWSSTYNTWINARSNGDFAYYSIGATNDVLWSPSSDNVQEPWSAPWYIAYPGNGFTGNTGTTPDSKYKIQSIVDTSNEASTGGYSRQSIDMRFARTDTNDQTRAIATNGNEITFSATGADINGITHAAIVARRNAYTLTMEGTTNGVLNTQGDKANTALWLPANYHELVTRLQVTDISADGTTSQHTRLTYAGSDYDFSEKDFINNCVNFVRVASGPYTGLCFEILADGTNTIDLDAAYYDRGLIGAIIEIRRKPTVAEFFGNTDDGTHTPSGFKGGSTSTADVYHLKATNSSTGDQEAHIVYYQIAPAFGGGTGWRKFGASASVDASNTCIPPAELSHQHDHDDDYSIMVTNESSDVTITSQLDNHEDKVIARLEATDGLGTASTINIADGSSLTIPAGNIKVTLS